MAILNRSFNGIFKVSSILLISVLVAACQIATKRESEKPPDKTLVDPKYSLSQDRSEFDKLRESIPEAKRKSNDEKAMLAEWMNGYKLPPNEIHERYEALIRKKRELFNKDMANIRDENSKTEKKSRDSFLKELDSEKSNFAKRKKDREERAEFYNQIDEKRRLYFSDERDKREEFESTVRDQRKNFEDYLKEKTLDFNSELKSYTDIWKAQKKDQ